jgi:hypothetical protein
MRNGALSPRGCLVIDEESQVAGTPASKVTRQVTRRVLVGRFDPSGAAIRQRLGSTTCNHVAS